MLNVTKKCPICKKPVQFEQNPHRPFCSERCKSIDLGAWAMEKYRIAGQRVDLDNLTDAIKETNDEPKQ